MRYFEWLFPVHRYGRLRREVTAWRAVMELGVLALLVTAAVAALAFVAYVRGIRATVLVYPPAPAASRPVLSLIRPFLGLYWAVLAVTAAVALLAPLAVSLPALVVSVLFVRHRPGRRRPKCMWQTFKFVLLGARTWVLATAAFVAAVRLSARLELPAGRWGLYWLVAIFTVALTGALLISAATAVMAAQAVIALQDDRRCGTCGYFLIHLTVPRCPECGTPFDPAKLCCRP